MASEVIEKNGEGSEPQPPVASKKKKIIVVGGVVAAVLLTASGGALYAFSGAGDRGGGEASDAAPVEEADFVEVDPMIVNLRTSGSERRFVKVHFVIVPTSTAAAERVRARLPLIIDSYQPFLRELRPEDLSGSSAVYRLKEELLLRAAQSVGPDSISEILIQDLVQQ